MKNKEMQKDVCTVFILGSKNQNKNPRRIWAVQLQTCLNNKTAQNISLYTSDD